MWPIEQLYIELGFEADLDFHKSRCRSKGWSFCKCSKRSQWLTREWRGEENFSLLYRARLLLLNSRIWGFLHLLLESRFLSLSLTLFLSFCQKNCVLRVWHSVLWRCYQFRFFWPMVIFWQTILLRFYALLLFWNYDRIMMTEKTHK